MTILHLEVRTIFLTMIPHNAPENHPLDETANSSHSLQTLWRQKLSVLENRIKEGWRKNEKLLEF